MVEPWLITNFGEVRGKEYEGWAFWNGSGFSGNGSLLDRFKVTNDSIPSGKESSDSPGLEVVTEIYKILPLDTPNQMPRENKVLSDDVFAILGHCSQTK